MRFAEKNLFREGSISGAESRREVGAPLSGFHTSLFLPASDDPLLLTVSTATIAADTVAVITLFVAFQLAISADRLVEDRTNSTSAAATVAADRVAVITLFGAFNLTITADRRCGLLFLTGTVATVAADRIAVIAGLRTFHDPVTADRNRTGSTHFGAGAAAIIRTRRSLSAGRLRRAAGRRNTGRRQSSRQGFFLTSAAASIAVI